MTYLTLCICQIFLLITKLLSLTMAHENQATTTTTELSVIEEHNVWIEINCYNITNYKKYQNLMTSRKNNIRNETRTLKIFNCPLPDDNNSLGGTLEKFGILLYHELLIQIYDFATTELNKQHLRNFQELQSLTIHGDTLKNLPSDLFTDATLKNLTNLVLHINTSEIPNNLLQNLENLKSLTISHSLESLATGQFHSQKKLMKLNLSNNKLKYIANNIFPYDGLIQTIYLQNNLLQTLPSDMFATLPSLISIDINSNVFENLPSKLFQNNLQLKKFVLTKNKGVNLITLPKKFLSNLHELKEIVIKCGLEFLPNDVFHNSTNIQKIILNHNKLKNLADNLLESQMKLSYLDLSHNHLNGINSSIFRNSKELKILKLNNNQLQTIERNLFTKLDNLQTLDLSHNQLNSNFRLELEGNTNLNNLYLQNNSISDLFILHYKLPQYLRKLDLSFNKIYELRGKNLELLYTNDLTLNLSHNSIQTIQLEDFGTYNLLDTLSIRTDLNHNPLQCDCKILKSVEYLINGYRNHLKFNVENLTCSGPIEIERKHVNDVKKMELLCALEPQYVGTYKCPKECECRLRLYDNILIMNCSHRNLSRVPIIESISGYNIKGIELNLNGNQITTLPAAHKGGYGECTKLFLYQNNLSEINKSQIPLNLTHLDLRENHLQLINEDTLKYLNDNRFLQTIYISGNRWKCDCSDTALYLSQIIQNNSYKFVNSSKLECNNYHKTQMILLNVMCQKKKIYNILTICLCISIIFIILTLYYKYRVNIKIWLYSHNICHRFVANYDDNVDLNKKYDAFISYSHKDEDFIANYLVPELENGCPSYKLCVHVRDFVVGDYIPDQIVKSIADSKRTIVVLSKNFIESEWAKMEFKEAYRATLTERRAKIIPIMYEDIGDLENLDKELRIYLKMNTYLKWGEPWFWKNLRYAMPHKK